MGEVEDMSISIFPFVSSRVCQMITSSKHLFRQWKSKPLRPEDYDGDWTDTEERTRIAVECHGKPG